MSALQAARLSVGPYGGDLGMLAELHAQQRERLVELATGSGPFATNGQRRRSQNGS